MAKSPKGGGLDLWWGGVGKMLVEDTIKLSWGEVVDNTIDGYRWL